MRPESRSATLLGVTRSKAKMYEYDVPQGDHIEIPKDPARLFPLSIGLLGDVAANINGGAATEDELRTLEHSLQFSAQFFDAYLQGKFNDQLAPYTVLLSAASYYLCDLPGSAAVLIRSLGGAPDVGAHGIEALLTWLLKGDLREGLDIVGTEYAALVSGIARGLAEFSAHGIGRDAILEQADALRHEAYANGSPRDLLFADIGCALVRKRLENSTWMSLPEYSGLPIETWRETLQRPSFVRELWPAQHLLGKHGVFRGVSATVQMPTSAGKTKATELIIRSAFLSGRTSLAVIVAPFRSLCHEIRNSFLTAFQGEAVKVDELTDVFQNDFDISTFIEGTQILVVTPEKLVYVLRHSPELANDIGLLIYDEGHQFDSGTRGLTYELLVASLRSLLGEHVQTVLISAVIGNAAAINEWLVGGEAGVVQGANLSPTYRTIAFASWQDRRGRLEFVEPADPDSGQFFVPRVLEEYELQLRPRETTKRIFPKRDDGQSIALYLGLKLVHNGSIAVFCGTKLTATGLCRKAVEAFERGLPLATPADFSDPDEIRKLHLLHVRNLGEAAAASESARLGILSHHGNSPHGLRLAVEHAMKEGLARFVVCTSTLAQGVNLPIRYLIVTSVYQGGERIKVRDFHNLIGRAGRSGMHTEGSILFADPNVFDTRNTRDGGWRWKFVKELLNDDNSEPCESALLAVFDPLRSDDGKTFIRMEALTFTQAYIAGPAQVGQIAEQIAARQAEKGFTKAGLDRQIFRKVTSISTIESYLMAHWDDADAGMDEGAVRELAESTLAYHLAGDETRQNIIQLFGLLANNIRENVPDASKRKLFGKTLYGVYDSLNVDGWVREKAYRLAACATEEDLLSELWPVIQQNTQNRTFRAVNPPEILKDIATDWIGGMAFSDLFKKLEVANARIGEGERPRRPTIEYTVEICENGLAYDGMLLIGAITELFENAHPENEETIQKLRNLQKRVKYGLATRSAIVFYELGFSDRVIATHLSLMNGESQTRRDAILFIRQNSDKLRAVLGDYPAYYSHVLKDILD